MSDVDDLRRELERRWSSHAAYVSCEAIFAYVLSANSGNLRHLTFLDLAHVASKSVVDDELLMALSILTNAPVPVLTPHFSIIDNEDREFELDELDVLTFRRSGVLVHPKTGLVLDEPDKHIVPYFAVSDGFLKLRETA